MKKKYQFRYQLPIDLQELEKIYLDTIAKVKTNLGNPKGIHLSLQEGLAFVHSAGFSIMVTTKLAFEPEKISPCYATTICHLKIEGKEVHFPYGGEDSLKANMYFLESPEVRLSEIADYHITEVTNYHAPFLKEHMEGRYVGTAFERACIILDVLGHLKLLGIKYNILGAYFDEFFDWLYRAAGISADEFSNQLNNAQHEKTMKMLERAQGHLNLGQFQLALNIYKACLDEQPANSDIFVSLGSALFFNGEMAEALACLYVYIHFCHSDYILNNNVSIIDDNIENEIIETNKAILFRLGFISFIHQYRDEFKWGCDIEKNINETELILLGKDFQLDNFDDEYIDKMIYLGTLLCRDHLYWGNLLIRTREDVINAISYYSQLVKHLDKQLKIA
jgi:tetratricopeptide (TPR) repeat protein